MCEIARENKKAVMDIIKEEPDLDEGTSQVFTLKEEPLIDIKHEDRYAVSPAVFLSEDKKFLDVIKLEPNSDTESDQLPPLEHVDLAVPKTSPVLKNEEMEGALDFATHGDDVMPEEHDLCVASQHVFTTHQYEGNNTEHSLQQTTAEVSEYEVSAICRKGSTCSGNLKSHISVNSVEKSLKGSEIKRLTEKTFTCDVCSKSFSYNCNLKRHIRIHMGVKSFKCDICGKVFLERGGMKHHLRTHTGERPSKCDICGKSFSNNGNLKSHIRIHTGEKPFKCDTCGRAFSNNGSLKHHTFTHTGEKPFKCDICGKLFSLSWNLKYHIRTHMGEKPFK